MSFAILFLILKWMGAAAGAINFLILIRDYIRMIRDKKEREVQNAKLRKLMWQTVKSVRARGGEQKMSVQDSDELETKARSLFHEVQSILAKEGEE